jgi:hypothetical protein
VDNEAHHSNHISDEDGAPMRTGTAQFNADQLHNINTNATAIDFGGVVRNQHAASFSISM